MPASLRGLLRRCALPRWLPSLEPWLQADPLLRQVPFTILGYAVAPSSREARCVFFSSTMNNSTRLANRKSSALPRQPRIARRIVDRPVPQRPHDCARSPHPRHHPEYSPHLRAGHDLHHHRTTRRLRCPKPDRCHPRHRPGLPFLHILKRTTPSLLPRRAAATPSPRRTCLAAVWLGRGL